MRWASAAVGRWPSTGRGTPVRSARLGPSVLVRGLSFMNGAAAVQTLKTPQPCCHRPAGDSGRPGPLLHRHPRQLWRLQRLRQLRGDPGVSLNERHHQQPAGLPSGWSTGHWRCQHLSLQRVSPVQLLSSNCRPRTQESKPQSRGHCSVGCGAAAPGWLGSLKCRVRLVCPCLVCRYGLSSHWAGSSHCLKPEEQVGHGFKGEQAPA